MTYTITININDEQLAYLGSALGEMPYRVSASMIAEISEAVERSNPELKETEDAN